MNPDKEYGLALSRGSVNGSDYNDRTKPKCLTHADTQHNANQEWEDREDATDREADTADVHFPQCWTPEVQGQGARVAR